MSQEARVFSLIGDSNIRRHVSKMSRRASPAMKTCQILPCSDFSVFRATTQKVRMESNVCIVSCLTNFLASSSTPGTVSQRVDGVLQDVRDVLLEACSDFPDRKYMVSPPMYRTTPVWYRDGLPEILSLFSQTMTDSKPANLHLLPSFPTPEYDSDGVHLTSFSGLEFIVSLFDGSEDLLDNLLKGSAERCDISAESSRVLGDRVMVLEQEHRRLNRFVEHKAAIDAELADFRENERFEDYFVVSGLSALPTTLTGKAWQEKAVGSVQDLIKIIVGRPLEIVVVQNVTSRKKDAEVTYNVKLASVDDSRLIRRKFGAFFHRGVDSRPANLKHISIQNRVTAETKIRISILKLMAKRYRDSNAGSKVQVIGFEPRPLIKITPPAGSGRTRVYNYVEACKFLPSSFAKADIDPIIRRISPRLRGQIKSTFIILSDDRSDPIEATEGVESAGNEDEAVEARRGVRRVADSPPGSPSAAKR